jgi:hypothetical protein
MTSYTDKKPGFKRVYTLTDDSLLIEAKKWFGGSFRLEFALNKVKPLPDEHRIKDDTKTALVGLPGFIVFFFGAIAGHRDLREDADWLLPDSRYWIGCDALRVRLWWTNPRSDFQEPRRDSAFRRSGPGKLRGIRGIYE